MENYSTASSSHTSSDTTPCQVYSPLPIRSPLALDICINLSEDIFPAVEHDIQVKPPTLQLPNKLLMKKLQRLERDDESTSDEYKFFQLFELNILLQFSFDYSFTDDQDAQCIEQINQVFKRASFIRPPSRASNPQIYDEVFCNQAALSFSFEKKIFEEEA